MIILNFSHPLTPEDLARIAELTGEESEVIKVPTQFDHERPFAEQVAVAVGRYGNLPYFPDRN